MKAGIELFRDSRGFTTVGAACAILVSCALVFACAWGVRSYSRASGVQTVADAAALAAQTEVSEFLIAVRVADATLFTLSLTSIALLGVGAVCCCVPPLAASGAKMIETANGLLQRRDAMAASFEKSLNALQDALPATAQLQAQTVIQENSLEIQGTAVGYVELVPQEGQPVVVNLPNTDDLANQANEDAQQISQAAQVAEEASARAEEAKRQAWLHDCGLMPSYCMAERAASLSSIDPALNAVAQSVNTWSFQMALTRARAYYRSRASAEAPQNSSVEEQARSALRKNFYEYACEELEDAKAIDTGVGIPDIDLPLLPRNQDEMKGTDLYTDACYPISQGMLHAWGGCPGVASVEGKGSVAQLDAGAYGTCPDCQLDANALGSVGSASTSIQNGFEHHYRKVAEAAAAYCAARAEAEPAMQEAKGLFNGLLEEIGKALGQVSACRVEASPPGMQGVLVAVTVDLPAEEDPTAFFEGADLGSFAAISAAVIMEDGQEDVLEHLLDGIQDDVGQPLVSAGRDVLGLWSALLGAYGSGVTALTEGVAELLASLPLAGASGLGAWASAALTEALAGAGLEPARTAAPKSVLSNTSRLAARGTGALSRALAPLKAAA